MKPLHSSSEYIVYERVDEGLEGLGREHVPSLRGGYYWRSVSVGDTNLTVTDATDAAYAAAALKAKNVKRGGGGGEESHPAAAAAAAAAAAREVTSARDVSEQRADFTARLGAMARQGGASGCAEWLDVTEEVIAAAPANLAVVNDPCCWHGPPSIYPRLPLLPASLTRLRKNQKTNFGSSSSCSRSRRALDPPVFSSFVGLCVYEYEPIT